MKAKCPHEAAHDYVYQGCSDGEMWWKCQFCEDVMLQASECSGG